MCIDATAGRDADPELARAGLLDISTAAAVTVTR
jgi:hypothetical protein